MGDVGPDGREKGCGSWFVARKIPPLDKNGLCLNFTAALSARKSTSQSALLTAPLSGEPLRTAICGLRRNGLPVGTAPTHKSVGRVFFSACERRLFHESIAAESHP